MLDLLQRFVADGFFGWQDIYGRDSLYSAADHLSLALADRAKEVSVYDHSDQAPREFEELAAYVGALGPGAGTLYAPTRGFLTAAPIESPDDVPEWPAAAGLGLHQVGAGQYVEGEALAFAWSTINANPARPFVAYNGQKYAIAVQIPGISFHQPP
jgi:hypothetical protein